MLAALSVGWSTPAAAQETPDEYADQWTEARRGDRDWKQRAVEQLTMGPMDRLFGPAADETMKPIINQVINKVEAMYRERRDPCLAAAVNMAHYQVVVTTGRQEVMRGATEMLFSAAGGAAGGRNVAEFLGQRLADQIKDKLKDQALEKFKEKMRDEFKKGLPQYYENSDRRGDCDIEFRIVWDKAAERYQFLVAGDCKCKLVSCGLQGGSVPLRRWAIEGWGAVIPEIEQLANGDKKVTFQVGMAREVSITADCCGQGDRRFRLDPRTGPGNAWVGVVQQPATTPQPPRPQTGTTPAAGDRPTTGQTGQPGRTPRGPAAPPPIQVPVIPDGPLSDAQIEELEQRVFDTEQRAQGERDNAYREMDEARKSHGAESPEAKAAEAAHEAAAETHRRARAARETLQRRVIDQANQQQSSNAAPSQAVQPTDPRMATILAEHNKARAEVGSPPLMWDESLAAGAAAYAQQLTTLGRVHSSREGRKDIRENLLQSLRGGRSPKAMVGVWIAERQYFRPGIFPNVSTTGNWADVGHYTQMIWPTTTRLGCGIHSDARYDWTVCRYSPPGNRDGSPILADNAPVRPDLPKLPVGGGMQQIDPPAPPPPPLPTARDPAPDDIESRHPLYLLAYAAFDRHAAAVKACDQEAARRALDEMRHAVSELEKRAKAARKAGRFSAINPDAVEQSLREARSLLRQAEDRSRQTSCPPLPPPPLPPRERG